MLKDWVKRVDNTKKRRLKSSIILGWGKKKSDEIVIIRITSLGNYGVIANTFNDIGVADNLTQAKRIATNYMRKN